MRHTTRAVVALAVAMVIAIQLPSDASAKPPAHGQTLEYVPGELIVKFKPGLSAAQRRDALSDGRAGLERRLRVRRTVLASVPAGADVDRAIAALEDDPRVARAEPNPYRRGGGVPNDELFRVQWGMSNTGQTLLGETGVPDADIDAPEAWDLSTGAPCSGPTPRGRRCRRRARRFRPAESGRCCSFPTEPGRARRLARLRPGDTGSARPGRPAGRPRARQWRGPRPRPPERSRALFGARAAGAQDRLCHR